MGIRPVHSKVTAIRLPLAIMKKIDALVGKGNRSKFIATAIEKELKRQARREFIATSTGFIDDDVDTLVFINRLRAGDERTT
ncbi:MAG: hypothetical protein C4570_09105 [Ammonifex sp.]|jgi:predicted transcriptional regulator|nr:MAG: hypothetical protein C4570_09105 [Ammonifex sp.]